MKKTEAQSVSTISAEKPRRRFLKSAAVGGAAILAMPHIRNAQAAETVSWKIQTSWPGGLGLQLFKDWCNSIKEKTGGELEFKPFGAKDVTGRFPTLRCGSQRRFGGGESVHHLLPKRNCRWARL